MRSDPPLPPLGSLLANLSFASAASFPINLKPEAAPTILAAARKLWGQLSLSDTPVAISTTRPAGLCEAPAFNGQLPDGPRPRGDGCNAIHIAFPAPKHEIEGHRRLKVDTNARGDCLDGLIREQLGL